jgi:hypothetical protein
VTHGPGVNVTPFLLREVGFFIASLDREEQYFIKCFNKWRCNMSILFTILAVLFAPILSLWVSIWWNDRREARKRKIDIFTNLMATRAAGLLPAHVDSLNRIDVEFYEKDKKSNDVIDAWKLYHDHLNYGAQEPKNEEEWKTWTSKKEDLLVELLDKMARSLGYRLDKVDIKRGHYYPRGYGDIENDQLIIRKGLVKIFENKAFLPVMVATVEPPKKEISQKQ